MQFLMEFLMLFFSHFFECLSYRCRRYFMQLWRRLHRFFSPGFAMLCCSKSKAAFAAWCWRCEVLPVVEAELSESRVFCFRLKLKACARNFDLTSEARATQVRTLSPKPQVDPTLQAVSPGLSIFPPPLRPSADEADEEEEARRCQFSIFSCRV